MRAVSAGVKPPESKKAPHKVLPAGGHQSKIIRNGRSFLFTNTFVILSKVEVP